MNYHENNIMQQPRDIEALLDKAKNMNNFDGMTYQDGIVAALEWVLNVLSDDPTE